MSAKANINITEKNNVVGFINPGKSTKDLTIEEYNEIMSDVIDVLNSGYTVDGFTGKDGKIILTIKEA